MHAKAEVNIRHFLRQGLSLSLELAHWPGWLAGQASMFLISTSTQGSRHAVPCPSFYMGTGLPNSGPYACTAGTLSTELSPQPQELFLFTDEAAEPPRDVIMFQFHSMSMASSLEALSRPVAGLLLKVSPGSYKQLLRLLSFLPPGLRC